MPRSAAFSALTTVSLLLFLELGARVFVDESPLLTTWEQPEGLIGLMGDRVYVRESVKSAGTDGAYVWTARTNALGLRANEDTPADLPAGQARLLALGDSWIFGTSITQDKTIPDQLGTLLSERTGQHTQVLNGGIPGGSAFEMLARWQELSPTLALTGVVLGIPHNTGRQQELGTARDQLPAFDGGAPYLDSRLYLLMRRGLMSLTRSRYAEPAGADPARDAGALQDVRTLVRAARDRGLAVWVIEWPSGNMDKSTTRIMPADRRWRAALEPEGAVFGGHALNTRACWGFADHGHPSEAGALAIATVMARVINDGERPKILSVDPPCVPIVLPTPDDPDPAVHP